MKGAVAVGVLAAALAAAGCGSGSKSGLACGSPAAKAVPATAGALPPARVLQRALDGMLARGGVHVRLALELETTLPPHAEDRYRGSGIAPARVRELADHPLCLELEGDAGGGDVDLEGTIDAAGRTSPAAIRFVDGRLYVRSGRRWYLGERLGEITSTETFGGLVPETACVRVQSEGCDRVDFRPPIRRGLVARLVEGRTGSGLRGTWVVGGRPDPDRLALLFGSRSGADYDPYERGGRVVVAAGKRDGLARALDVRLDVPPRRIHLGLELTRWGERVHVARPHVSGRDPRREERAFTDFLTVLLLYY